MQRLKSFQIWGFRLVDMISRIVGALVEPTPVAVEADADSLAIERNLVLLWIVFFCLGLYSGSPWFNMKSIASWKTLVDRFHMRLSSWKANLLSIGGRLTLIKSVLGSLGGLNIGSLKAFNLALLQKWRWRLLSPPKRFGVLVIKAYHGQEGGFDTNGCSFQGALGLTIYVNGKSDGVSYWMTGGSQSNAGIAIAVTVMAGLAVAATIVYSNRALRRSHTSKSSSPPKSASPKTLIPTSSGSSSSSSWIHLRSVLLVVASSSTNSPISTNRGHLKSPWSRRRRKHALLPKQWKTFFDEDERLCDGGVKFLKKVRSGGVHPSLRAEVWPFLLGVAFAEVDCLAELLQNYDLKSSKEERDAVKSENREEYEKLREQCRLTYKHSDESTPIKEICETNSDEDSIDCGEVIDSSAPEVIASSRDSVSPGKEHSAGQNLADGLKQSEGGDGSEITCKSESESSDSDSSEEADDMHPSPAPEKVAEETDITKDDTASSNTGGKAPISYRSETFATWQRIIRLDAIRANDEWIVYTPSQAAVSSTEANKLAESVCLKDYNHLEPCRIYHASRLVSILEAYALHDSEIGYCQGMSDLLSPIISVMEDDSEAFWCFVGFMKKARHNFRLDEVGIRRQLNIVSKIIKGKDSQFYKHLVELQAEDCFFVYRMVVVLFRRELSFEQTLCLWEVMWADQTAIRAGITKSAWGRMRLRAPPTDDLLLYAIAACVLQRRKLIIEKYSSMDEILRECNSMAGHLDVWKLLDDAHDLVVTLHDKI
ncbi:GTPase-activating protein GYP7-like protein isoform X1 [Tanacetum coccineum]